MKGSRFYILGLVIFLLLVFLYQYFSPKEFVWNPTFYTYDKQPFGSYVFDDVMATSVEGYKVESKTFYQIYGGKVGEIGERGEIEEIGEGGEIGEIGEMGGSYGLTVLGSYDLPALPLEERRAFLVTEDEVTFSEVDVRALLNLLRQGHKVMLCLHSFPQALRDSIGFSQDYDNYFAVSAIARYAQKGNIRDSLYLGTDSLYPERIYAVYPHLHPIVLKEGRPKRWLERDSLENEGMLRCDWSETIVRNKQGKPVAIRLGIGEGELILVATPLMFTNYGMLDGNNASYAFRLLSYMRDLPLTRIEAYGRFANQASGSPLRYLLSQPSLRWASIVTLLTLLLCMIFTAKRRQRVIPVINPPANETLRFTQLIGNLYYQRKDYKDMLQKKYLYFCTEVKLQNGLDLHSNEPDEELCHRLADKMGRDLGAIWPVFRELKYLLREDVAVDETSMMRMIDKMNEWIK